jgi:hypothetical protein
LEKTGECAKYIRVDRVFGEHGIRRDESRGMLEFERRMESQRLLEKSKESRYKEFRRGRRFSSEEFVARMLDRIDGTYGESLARREPVEGMERRGEQIAVQGLRAAEWDAERFLKERKGHPVKVRLARKLRSETTMTAQWIAENLSVG